MATVFKRGGKVNRGGYWYVAWFDHTGKRRSKCTKTTDKATAERIGRQFDDNAAKRREGLIDPSEDRFVGERRREVLTHLDEFRKSLQAKGNTAEHCDETYAKALRLIVVSGASFAHDLTASSVQDALRQLRAGDAESKPIALKTCNHYLRAIKSFTRWMHRDKRTRDDALVTLESFNAETDRKLVRRELSTEEYAWLIRTTEGRSLPEHAMSGPDRAMLYRLAVGTGFRAGELRSLRPASFHLDGPSPTVTVAAAHSKRRREDTQPIRSDLATMLKRWLAAMPAGVAVFNRLPLNLARMLRPDMAAARVAWIDAASSPADKQRREKSDFLQFVDSARRTFDFHAFRHTFVSAVVNGGASVKVAQELARHSTPTLTIGRYSHTRLHDLEGALHALPATGEELRSAEQPAQLRATGTDNDLGSIGAQRHAQQLGRETAVQRAIACVSEAGEAGEDDCRKVLPAQRKREALQLSATPRVRYPLGESNQ